MGFKSVMCAIGASFIVAACGGGGGSAGTNLSGSNGGTTPATAKVADFAMFTDKSAMNNSGSDTAQLTVVAVDASRNVVPGAKVAVTTDGNAVFTPQSAPETDATGTYTGKLTIGGDKSDRDVTFTVTVNGVTKRTSVRVAGSKLTLQTTPTNPSPGQAIVVNATLVDSAGTPISGAAVTFGGTFPGLQGLVVTTNSLGVASRSVSAPASAGVYTITASGSGISAGEYQTSVFSSAVPVATIPAGSVPSLSASPNVLAVNSVGSSLNKATLRFLFLDSANRPVSNVRVRFEDTTTGLPGVGASVASGSTTLYTDTSGSVSTQYISGQNSSPTNGVTVRACYSATDFTSATHCPASVATTLTVGGQALAVSIGDDNLLEKGSGTYIKRFAVTVADSAGRAVASAPVDISVDLTHFSKGTFAATGTTTVAYPPLPTSLTEASPSDTTSVPNPRVWCANEDRNRNGNVDPGENLNSSVDSNGQPTLEPRKSDLIVSYDSPSVTTTNQSGILVIKVEYSQRFATWLAYRVRVTANVSGSQGLAERTFITNFVEGDEVNGSFLSAPYGNLSCQSAS